MLAAEGAALTGLWMKDQRFFGAPYAVLPAPQAPDGVLLSAAAWLRCYFAGEKPLPPSFPLAPRGSAFQRRVWQALRRIPYGETRSYGELAVAIGSCARAVGGAVARNPLSIIIPCHRVIAADGDLGGYAGGTSRKRLLLEIERGRSATA